MVSRVRVESPRLSHESESSQPENFESSTTLIACALVRRRQRGRRARLGPRRCRRVTSKTVFSPQHCRPDFSRHSRKILQRRENYISNHTYSKRITPCVNTGTRCNTTTQHHWLPFTAPLPSCNEMRPARAHTSSTRSSSHA